MRFLLDMGVSVRVAEGLRSDGHDIHHLDELGLNELKGVSVFERGIDERRVIATFDLDFSEIAAFAGGPMASVLSLRLYRIRAAIESCGEALEAGAIVSVEQSRCRVRRYPIRPE